MSHACGVDFGTSNSTVAWHQPDQPEHTPGLLALEDEKPTLPSVVFFNADEDEVSYGRAALATYLAGYEGRLMRSMKSLLGTSLMEGQTEVQGRSLPFRQLLSQFISELKQRAERSAGQHFERAVMGRPVHFIDDNQVADRLAQDTLEEIALAAGFKEIQFQYEPIAAAFDYESRIRKEELVLIADIGGGTSDFSLVRLAPERAHRTDRYDDILGNGGVHIGGTDFDKYLSLAHIMPLLGLGGQLASSSDVPSSYYFNLATWHTINLTYTQKVWRELQDVYRDIGETDIRLRFERLLHLVEQRDGHWLAIKAEDAKIQLSDHATIDLVLERLRGKVPQTASCVLTLGQPGFLQSIQHLTEQIGSTVSQVLALADVSADEVDTVFFTGGSSGVRGLRDRISAIVPDAKKVEGDLFGSIGTGLGLDAYRRYA
ncbi:Hsp70 family protein [Undibacterium sp. Jales W-56]|uniref:Hsp70 family protein n=1 Tax=Undibacterium sp. Jales W-56 TaxID=2897325 RepID=UPI0021D162CA|nr:Hsp70 family protein [Undibacterium sp. Jales W-56]MCU6434234.1 Hsp70 family protein [Undibacterium sp. Jales W-56]